MPLDPTDPEPGNNSPGESDVPLLTSEEAHVDALVRLGSLMPVGLQETIHVRIERAINAVTPIAVAPDADGVVDLVAGLQCWYDTSITVRNIARHCDQTLGHAIRQVHQQQTPPGSDVDHRDNVPEPRDRGIDDTELAIIFTGLAFQLTEAARAIPMTQDVRYELAGQLIDAAIAARVGVAVVKHRQPGACPQCGSDSGCRDTTGEGAGPAGPAPS